MGKVWRNSKGMPGSAGIQGPAGPAGANGSDGVQGQAGVAGADGVGTFTEYSESPLLSLTTAYQNYYHGLSAAPRFVKVEIRCVKAYAGYRVGDRCLEFGNWSWAGVGNFGITPVIRGNHINFKCAGNGGVLVVNRATGGWSAAYNKHFRAVLLAMR